MDRSGNRVLYSEKEFPITTEFYERTTFEQYRLVTSEVKPYKMRPRTPSYSPPPPQGRHSRSRSRSRSPRRRRRYSPKYSEYTSVKHREHREHREHTPVKHRDYSPGKHREHEKHSSSQYDHHYHRHQVNARESPQANRCIGIFGLSERTTERDVKRIFTKYGHIEDVNLIFDNYTGRSRGYCFVYFSSLKDAIRAVESSGNLRIDARYVRVDYSITDRPRDSVQYERKRHHDQHSRHGSPPRHRRYSADLF